MNNQRVIVHIGPDKTGSTSIQSRLAASVANLAANGICYAPDYGIADMVLGRQLSNKESVAVNDEDWWSVGDFPAIDDPSMAGDILNSACRIYSSETFCDADYLAARQWASRLSYATCEIVSAIREPRAWLLSSYFQESLANDLDFESYVTAHLKSKKYFISYLSSLWALPRSRFRAIPHRRGRDIWIDFCRVAEIPAKAVDAYFSSKNESPKLIESLYYCLLPSYIKRYLPRVVDWAGEIPSGFIKRSLVDIKVVARPFSEWSMQWMDEDFLNRKIITADPLPVLEEYSQAWLDDAESCVSNGVVFEGDLQFIREALEEYKVEGFRRMIIPSANFKEKLPINVEWEVLVRLISVAIAMRRQGTGLKTTVKP